jgi:DNA-binding response OmpR family regulator
MDHIPTILIAEDEPMLQEMYAETCQAIGLAFQQTFEGLETWQVLEDHADDFDAIILDLMMPGMSGEAILGRLQRKHPKHPPIIVVSAIAEAQGDLDALTPGSVVYIVKGDIGLRRILSAIQAYCNGYPEGVKA